MATTKSYKKLIFKNIILFYTHSSTGNYNAEILGRVYMWNICKNRIGYCFDSNTGFTIEDYGVRSPDVSWIAKERWELLSREEKEKCAKLCPDFVIELASKSDNTPQNLKTLKEKMEMWIKQDDCKLAWLINPYGNPPKSYVYTKQLNPANPIEYCFCETLDSGDTFCGFKLCMDDIYL